MLESRSQEHLPGHKGSSNIADSTVPNNLPVSPTTGAVWGAPRNSGDMDGYNSSGYLHQLLSGNILFSGHPPSHVCMIKTEAPIHPTFGQYSYSHCVHRDSRATHPSTLGGAICHALLNMPHPQRRQVASLFQVHQVQEAPRYYGDPSKVDGAKL